MWLILLEALAALGLLLFLVWWTMFSGRDKEAADRGGDVAGPAGPAREPSAGGDQTDRG